MNSHEVVTDEVERKGRIVIFPFLAESVCQAGESANLHSHAEVLTLHMRTANLVRVGASDDWEYLHCDHFRRGVPVLALG